MFAVWIASILRWRMATSATARGRYFSGASRIPEAFPQLNGGVILYRANAAVHQMLADWKQAYHTAGFKWDQVTLRELLWKSDLRLFILPPEYNVRYSKYLEVWEADEARPKILHFAAVLRCRCQDPGGGEARRRQLARSAGVGCQILAGAAAEIALRRR